MEQDHRQDAKTPRKDLSEKEEQIAGLVVDAAIQVHTHLGPGLLESVYEQCLAHELKKRGLTVLRQVVQPIYYDGIELESGLRLDMLIENLAIVELKAVEALLPVHEAQLLSYLRLSGKRLGFILNFNVPLMRDGILRRVITH